MSCSRFTELAFSEAFHGRHGLAPANSHPIRAAFSLQAAPKAGSCGQTKRSQPAQQPNLFILLTGNSS